MSEVCLVIRDVHRDIHAHAHGSFADSVVAALSVEPETIEELEAGLDRFLARGEASHFAWFRPGIDEQPYDAGLVIVDLAARLVVCESTYSSPGAEGSVQYHDGRCATGTWVRYHLSDDWKFTRDVNCWAPLAEKRRGEREANPPLDARSVLYGRALLEFIAGECLQSFAGVAAGQTEDAEHGQVREIHARWLMTPRDDLRGHCPRDLLMARKSYVERDLEDRASQWSQTDRCPQGLDQSSAAFRFAGFGTHEIVIYYYLVRELLWSCREAVAEFTSSARGAPMLGDFLTVEVPRLARAQDEWLDTPNEEYDGRTPRSIIDNERARLPEGVSPHEAIIDHDCPMCAMMADMPGPMFWHLDGCNMDDDFAFSFHETREEWEAERREWDEFSRRMDAKWAEQERLGVKYPGQGYADPDDVWKRSFVAPESADTTPAMRLFAIGCHLSELIVDLKELAEDRESIDRLSRDFGNLREVVQSADPAAAEALLQPVLEQFCESLETVAAAHTELEPKCTDLQRRLRRFLEPPMESSDERFHERFDDDELPF
jgi:hypothetical protein